MAYLFTSWNRGFHSLYTVQTSLILCELFIYVWMQRENWNHQREAGLSTYVWVTVVPRRFESLLCRDWEGNTLFIIICTITRLRLYLTMKNFRKLLVLFQNLKICLRTIFVIIDIDCKLYECIEEKHIKTKDIWYQIMLAFIKEKYWLSIVLFTLLLKCKL